ncbi:MAG: Helix-turn-helix domain protein [Candidatus Bathyarchaeota archaeon BA1]|nr:MAG: Helix-turn-helix domain protein [Candidatus Bathyarchaeota archaeon BA1]
MVFQMKKRLLLSVEREHEVKDLAIFDHPEGLKAALSEMGWKILELLSEEEMYPIEIARRLGVHEQKVYYHIRKLARAGLIKVVREEEKKGAIAKYYKVSFPAFGVELPLGYRKIRTIPIPSIDERMEQFLRPLLKEDGSFDGKIVVGSPDPHGPFKARARDGHYASYLTLFLGRFVELPEDFIIKLDVDVKAEKEEGNNLILVGGPGTNLITEEINRFLPIRFNMMPTEQGFLFGGLVSEKTGNVYTSDTVGVIAKITSPWNKDKSVIVLAGNKAVGTKACVLALTKFWKDTLKNFSDKEEFATVIQGFDLDGDGKVDSIEVLE